MFVMCKTLVSQVKQLFGFCGQVKSCRMVGNNQFAFVEYSSPGVSTASCLSGPTSLHLDMSWTFQHPNAPKTEAFCSITVRFMPVSLIAIVPVLKFLLQEANAAMGLNGQMLGDRALKVENAKSARETTPQGATNPYSAMQLQQMQQLQLAQMQSSTLAAQVGLQCFTAVHGQPSKLCLPWLSKQPSAVLQPDRTVKLDYTFNRFRHCVRFLEQQDQMQEQNVVLKGSIWSC